jgi:hypothetical protein
MRAIPPLARSARVIWSCSSRATCGLVLVVEALEMGILGGLAIVFVWLEVWWVKVSEGAL